MIDFKDVIQNHGLEFSMGLVLFIVLWLIIGFIYINNKKRNDTLLDHKGIIEMFPSLISTLGVLGTFAGITIGLYFFDTKDLSTSIPMLLSGLKTAFFTSLAGMVGSLAMSAYVNRLLDEKTGGVSDSEEAAGIIVKALEGIQEQSNKQAQTQTLFYNAVQKLINKIDQNTSALSQNANAMTLALNSIGVEVSSIGKT